MINKIINIQRKLRANLSFFYNQDEINDKKEKILANELKLLANKLLKSNGSNYKHTHKIFSKEILNLILEKKLLNFLKYSFVQKMFFVHNRLFLNKYLNELKRSKSWLYWRRLLIENKIGNPIRYFLEPSTSGNKIFQTYHLKKYNDFVNKKLNNYQFIFEFGGGYGNMATTFQKINHKVKFIIFDTPELNLLQYYYIKKNKMDVGIGYKNKKKKILLINSLIDLKKIINENKNKKKLFVANWSLSETPLSLRKKIESVMDKFDFQLISFQHKFENIDNVKYFKKLNYNNIKKKRLSKIIPIPYLKNNYYLFSKK